MAFLSHLIQFNDSLLILIHERAIYEKAINSVYIYK
jgi:hypothetical protein